MAQNIRPHREASPGPLVAAPKDLAFLDSQSLALPHEMSALCAWDKVMANPLPGLRLAMTIRDAVSGLFGVKPIHGFSRQRRHDLIAGDHLDFFLVERIEQDLMVLTARDKHLDVMTSVSTKDSRLTITSSVLVHNWFGHVYMLPVAPAHRLIVWSMLRRLRKSLAAI